MSTSASKPFVRCGMCRVSATTHSSGVCETCRRRAAIGTIVEVFLEDWLGASQHPIFLDGLEAVGTLMELGGIERKRHRRELNEAIREEQSSASAAYREGRRDGIEQERGGDW